MRSPKRRKILTVSLERVNAALPVAPVSQEEAYSAEKGSRRSGFLLVVVGALLLALAVEDARADVVLGGGSGDMLRGTDGSERLAGFGGKDDLGGFVGDDEIYGGGGDDEIYGGPGRDALLGGAGDDFIEAKDGERDYLECGSGNDVVSVDLADRVARDCETLYPG